MNFAIAAETDGFFCLSDDFLAGEVVSGKADGEVFVLPLIRNVHSNLPRPLHLRVPNQLNLIIKYRFAFV